MRPPSVTAQKDFPYNFTTEKEKNLQLISAKKLISTSFEDNELRNVASSTIAISWNFRSSSWTASHTASSTLAGVQAGLLVSVAAFSKQPMAEWNKFFVDGPASPDTKHTKAIPSWSVRTLTYPVSLELFPKALSQKSTCTGQVRRLVNDTPPSTTHWRKEPNT
jgi:hypothetical protein